MISNLKNKRLPLTDVFFPNFSNLWKVFDGEVFRVENHLVGFCGIPCQVTETGWAAGVRVCLEHSVEMCGM